MRLQPDFFQLQNIADNIVLGTGMPNAYRADIVDTHNNSGRRQ